MPCTPFLRNKPMKRGLCEVIEVLKELKFITASTFISTTAPYF
jgi:hypothetical protein